MTTRSCAYKDCDYVYSVHDSTATKGPWTLFSFPKQSERARIWFENGQVQPKIPHNQLFMCSKHFDRKFISSSKNRTMLLGEAIPFPYKNVNDPEPEEKYAKMISPISSSTEQENYYINLSDDEENVVSTSRKHKNVKVETIAISIGSPSAKRSREATSVPPASVNPPSTKTSSPADSDADNIEAIDTSEVSVFNFKGQEYVQMSMEFYMREKRMVAELLRKYRETLRNIKDQVFNLDV